MSQGHAKPTQAENNAVIDELVEWLREQVQHCDYGSVSVELDVHAGTIVRYTCGTHHKLKAGKPEVKK